MGKTYKDDTHKGYKRVSRNVQKDQTKDDNQNRYATKVVPNKKETDDFDWKKEVAISDSIDGWDDRL